MYDEEAIARPRDEDHLWEMIETNFEHARHIFEDYPFETKDDAIAGRYRPKPAKEGGKRPRRQPMDIIAFTNVAPEYDQRDYCYEMGKATLPIVTKLILARQLTPEFFQEWGKLMFCHGYIAAHFFSTSSDIGQLQGALNSKQKRSSSLQKRWLAHLYDRLNDPGATRDMLDTAVVSHITSLMAQKIPPAGFANGWLKNLLSGGQLRVTFDKNHLTGPVMMAWRKQGLDGLPPLPTRKA